MHTKHLMKGLQPAEALRETKQPEISLGHLENLAYKKTHVECF